MNPNKILSILITHRCNLQCDFCYVDAENLSSYQENGLSLSQWQMILKEAQTLGFTTLHIFGGEPFLYPKLSEFCQIAVNHGFQILIATNGTAFHESDKDWILKLKNSLQFSFTVNDIEHDWVQLPSIKKEWLLFFKENQITITIVTCITSKNLTFYRKFLKEFTLVGNNRWGFFGIYYSPIGRGKDHLDNIIPPDTWINTIKELTDKFPVRIEQSFYPTKEIDNIPLVPKMCPMISREFITIDHDGYVYPCFLCVSNERWSLGRWDTEGDLNEINSKLDIEWIEKRLTAIHHMTSQESHQEILNGSCPIYIIKTANGILTDFRNTLSEKNKQNKIICPLYTLD